MPAWVADQIRGALPRWEVVVPSTETEGTGDGTAAIPAELLDAIRGAEVYLGYGFPRDLFLAATTGPPSRLRWVHSGSAGVRSALYPEMRDSEVLLTNSAGVHAPPIADTVLGMILYFARGFDFAVEAKTRGAWDTSGFWGAASPLREIAGATLGLLGLGGIGREVALRGIALGMRVLATKRRPGGAPEGVEVMRDDEGLARLLRESDYLVVTAPDTAETRGLLSAERLAAMKPGAVLINVSRGSIVDEDALAEALAGGRLRGAGLDVFRTEPLPPDSPLWRLPNALILPHVSAVTDRFWEREAALVVENLRRYLDGRPLLNLVDKRSGY
jgi:phosphoglycerate dehydrogenase-like enzyme